MAKAFLGNHSAVRVRRAERQRIQQFYRDVLGCVITRELDDKDDIRMGDDFHIAVLHDAGDGREVDTLGHDDFLKAMFLELKTDNVDEMRRKITAFGVRVLDVPDPHLYFQAPGGQVWRLVGMDEDLSKYEGNE